MLLFVSVYLKPTRNCQATNISDSVRDEGGQSVRDEGDQSVRDEGDNFFSADQQSVYILYLTKKPLTHTVVSLDFYTVII